MPVVCVVTTNPVPGVMLSPLSNGSKSNFIQRMLLFEQRSMRREVGIQLAAADAFVRETELSFGSL